MPRPVPQVVELLEAMLEDARRGHVTDLFVIHRDDRGDYGSAYWTADLDDMTLQVGTEHLRLHASGKAERDEPRH